jgi:hypothetical protein
VNRRSPLRFLVALAVLAGALTGGLALLVEAFRSSPPAPAPAFTPAALPAPRPATTSPPVLPRAGGVSAAIWVRSDQPPVPAVDLVQSAGVPAVMVRTAAEAFAHPLVLVWPESALAGGERDRARTFVARGGHLLAVAPDAATRAIAAAPAGGVLERLDLAGISAPTERDRAVQLLRSLWARVPGGFRLVDLPGGAARGLVAVHEVDSTAAALAAPGFVLDERARDVQATYAVQGRVLSSADGPLAAAQARAALGEVRKRGGELVGAGMTGVPLDRLPDAALLADLRRGLALVGGLTGLAPSAVRAEGGAGDRVAAAEQSAGVTIDASLPATAAGGDLPFVAGNEDGVRPLLRVPVVDAASGLPTTGPAVVAAGTVPLVAQLDAQNERLASLGTDAWVGGLGAYGRFWEDRLSLAVDIRPARSGEQSAGWFVRLQAARTVTGQALVAPFDVAFAAAGTGRSLHVAADGRTIVLPAFRSILVQVAARQAGGG